MAKVTKIIIEIDTDNAAFDEARDNLTYNMEVMRILGQVELVDGYKLYDYNGNAVGSVKAITE